MALILTFLGKSASGSSTVAIATAKKLAKHGMNICIIHRNSRSQLNQIEKDFKEIKSALDFYS